MTQPKTRNKTRKRQAKRRRANSEQDARGSMRAQGNRQGKSLRRGAVRSRVPEMPEDQARQRRGGAAGESGAVIVSPTGTKHRAVKRKTARVAKSRAKSPSLGRQKEGRTAKA